MLIPTLPLLILVISQCSEFLTGFSKRKQAKLTEKREKAKERDKLEQAKEKREVSCFRSTFTRGFWWDQLQSPGGVRMAALKEG